MTKSNLMPAFEREAALQWWYFTSNSQQINILINF